MPAASWYSSGERVFGPPAGTFDAEWVAREVQRRTGVDFARVHQAVEAAWMAARASGSLDRGTLAAAARAGASGLTAPTADLVADQVIGYCQAYRVDPAAR